MDLLALADFNLVVAHAGFGRAARATNRAKATLSRRVSELEAELGVRLFERGARTLRLTQEGAALHARIEQPLGELAEAADEAANGTAAPRGRLRVSAPILFAETCLGRVGAAFAARYPEVRLEITAENRDADIVEEGFDVAIRVNPEPNSSLTGRRIQSDRLLVCSTKPAPAAGAETDVPAVVLTRSPPDDRWRVELASGERVFLPRPTVRFSSVSLVRDALLAGAGAALLPLSLVAADLDQGRLVSWGELADYEIDVWVLHASRRLVSTRVAAFVQFLADAVADPA